jgi:hypothetical protein
MTQQFTAMTQQIADLERKFEEQERKIARDIAELDKRLGARIESLVSAIGEFIRNRPATG